MQQHMSGRVQSLIRQTRAWGTDSVHLAQSLYRSWRVHPKPLTLLLHDHLDNPVAVQLLSVHKEYNLLRYYGFRGYIEQRRKSLNAIESEKASLSNSTSAAPSSSLSVARISFMVTARMKEELVNDLGYSPEFVAKLKPLEASLLLQHQVRNATPDTLAQLVQTHELEQERIAQQHQKEEEAQRIDQSQKAHQDQSSEAEVSKVSLDGKDTNSRDEEARPTLFTNLERQRTLYGSSSSTPLSSSAAATNGRVWYELVERTEDEHVTVLGLYTSEKDAMEGLEAHQFLAERNRRPAGDLEVRRTTR